MATEPSETNIDLHGAKWITAPDGLGDRLPVFRRRFQTDRPVARAEAMVCGLGHFELSINGCPSGESLFEPGWTDYRKTCLLVRQDLSGRLVEGLNELQVFLGNGMYSVGGKPGRYRKFKGTFGPLKLIVCVRIERNDGSVDQVVSDESWQVAPGPIRFSCIYGGEDFDARLAAVDPGDWRPVELCNGPGGRLVEQRFPPIRVTETFPIARETSPERGVRVYDFGQNLAGRPRIVVSGRAGQAVRLYPGELLDANGRVTQKHSGSPVWFEYTLAGGSEEAWTPRFSYTGFRYIEARGAVEVIRDIRSEFIHSSAKVVGEFECSNDLYNRIHRLILAAMRSNMQSVFTDCPHREKLGWLEQTHLVGPGILWNFAAESLLAKTCRDMRDAQGDDGSIPTIAPQYVQFQPPWDVFNHSPEWGAAIVLAPWMVYRRTGDATILRENYDAMRRFARYLASRGDRGIVSYGLGDWYDVGPKPPGFSQLTTAGVTGTATLFQVQSTMSQVARLLEDLDAAAAYQAAAEATGRAFHKRFFDAVNGFYDHGSQTAQAMPLALGMTPPRHAAGVLRRLIADIESRNYHVSAGDVGFRYVVDALAAHGRSDVLAAMLLRTDPPGYGAQLQRGATALTEAWDADGGKSQNHFMLGHAEAWFYERLVGIRVDFSRPEQIVIDPAVVGDIVWARARHECPRGEIAVSWERSGDRFRLEVAIPPGLPATVHLPATDGGPHASGAAAELTLRGGVAATYQATPGRHVFESTLPTRID